MGVSQRIDLAVIGRAVGFIGLLVAAAAILSDEQPGWVFLDVADAMRRMAIRACRRLGVGEALNGNAVNEALIFGSLLRVAAAADLRGRKPELGAGLRLHGKDRMRRVAIDTGRVGPRRVIFSRPRWNQRLDYQRLDSCRVALDCTARPAKTTLMRTVKASL